MKTYRIYFTTGNTGTRFLNNEHYSINVSTEQDINEEHYRGDSLGSFWQPIKTWKDYIINSFLEDVSQKANERLLDTCKGHKWSIPRHNKFEWHLKTLLENNKIYFEEI